jgi:hypothetical protein
LGGGASEGFLFGWFSLYGQPRNAVQRVRTDLAVPSFELTLNLEINTLLLFQCSDWTRMPDRFHFSPHEQYGILGWFETVIKAFGGAYK